LRDTLRLRVPVAARVAGQARGQRCIGGETPRVLALTDEGEVVVTRQRRERRAPQPPEAIQATRAGR
jgi:hypothetical protein